MHYRPDNNINYNATFADYEFFGNFYSPNEKVIYNGDPQHPDPDPCFDGVFRYTYKRAWTHECETNFINIK